MSGRPQGRAARRPSLPTHIGRALMVCTPAVRLPHGTRCL